MDRFEKEFCAYVPFFFSWSWDKFHDTLELRRYEGEASVVEARVFTRDGDYSWVVTTDSSNPKRCDGIYAGMDAVIEELGIKEIRYLREQGG